MLEWACDEFVRDGDVVRRRGGGGAPARECVRAPAVRLHTPTEHAPKHLPPPPAQVHLLHIIPIPMPECECYTPREPGGQGGGAGGTHARAPHSLLHPLPPLATQADMGSNDYIFTLDADPKRDAANVRGRAAEGECVWGGGMLVRSFVFGVLSLGACPSRPAARPPSPGRPTRK